MGLWNENPVEDADWVLVKLNCLMGLGNKIQCMMMLEFFLVIYKIESLESEKHEWELNTLSTRTY